MKKSILFPGVGIDANVDHVCVETAFNKFNTVILFFRKLGYEIGERNKKLDCKQSATMVKEGCVSIQLRESIPSLRVLSFENHIGILVDDPKRVWQGIMKWADKNGISVEMAELQKGKMYISIPEVVGCVFELVSTDVCPECGGLGKVIRGCDGQSYYEFCLTCNGHGIKKK